MNDNSIMVSLSRYNYALREISDTLYCLLYP